MDEYRMASLEMRLFITLIKAIDGSSKVQNLVEEFEHNENDEKVVKAEHAKLQKQFDDLNKKHQWLRESVEIRASVRAMHGTMLFK